MCHIRVLVCQGDDGPPDLMSELACFDLATPDVATLLCWPFCTSACCSRRLRRRSGRRGVSRRGGNPGGQPDVGGRCAVGSHSCNIQQHQRGSEGTAVSAV